MIGKSFLFFLIGLKVRFEMGMMANPVGTVFGMPSVSLLTTNSSSATQKANTIGSAFSFSLPSSSSASSDAPSAQQPAPSFKFALPGAAANPAPVAAPVQSFSFKLPTADAAAPAPAPTQPGTSLFKPSFGVATPFAQSTIATPFAAQSSTGSDTALYSSSSSLTKEELEQFGAAKFSLGKIPMNPPPRELCV